MSSVIELSLFGLTSRMARSTLAMLFLTLVTVQSAQSSAVRAPISLGDIVSAQTSGVPGLGHQLADQDELKVNAELRTVAVDQTIKLHYPPESRDFTYVTRKVVATSLGNTYISAKGEQGAEARFLITNDGSLIGSVDLTKQRVAFQSKGARTLVTELDMENVKNRRAGRDWVDSPVHGMPRFMSSVKQAKQSSRSITDPTVISVGVLYDYKVAAEWLVDPLIDYYLQYANEVFQDSGLDLAFVMVGKQLYDPGFNYADMNSSLRLLTCGSTDCSPGESNSPMDSWRRELGADFVALLIGEPSLRLAEWPG